MPDTPSTLPSGMLTVMFTDVEGSTTRWEHAPDAMRVAMATHDAVLTGAIERHGGVIFKHTGDGMGAVFTSPNKAAAAAIEVQRTLQAHPWQGIERLKVRIGLHLGDIEPTGNDYFGPPVNRAARIMDVANGDQIAVSGVVARFLHDVDTRRMGSHQLKGIGTETIELVSAPGLVVDERPLRARVSQAVKPLPAPVNRLIGRDSEVDRMSRLVADHQLVTVVGPGGVGKTHFAIEVGRAVQHQFADGVLLCELAPLPDGAAVLDKIAEAIGARVQPEMTLRESILDFLEERELLLLLDNCEHVIEAINDFAETVAPFPDVHLVATSRERLGVRSEQVFGLEPLDPTGSAVELFLERARERDLSFEPDTEALDAIRAICQRLDGIPLGIELAAAWVRVLSPQQLLDRLADRFEVLERTRSRAHRQTLRETVEWSYDHLDEVQQALFRRLSVFAGGFSIDAAVAVCSDEASLDATSVLDVMMSLVDKSMVTSERGTGQIRFSMLATLREFGHDQLTETGEATGYAERHADFFLGLAHQAADALVSSKEAETWDLLDREWANLRTAFTTLLERDDAGQAIALVLDLGWFAALSLRSELFAWAEELAERPDIEGHSGVASILGLVAIHQYLTIDDRSVATAQRALELDPSEPYGFSRLALTAESLNNVHIAEDSEVRTSAWLDQLDETSPPMSRMWALGMRVFHLCSHAPSPEAAELHAKMERLAETSESASAMAVTRWAGGMVATFESVEAGLAEWRRGLDSAQSISDVHLLVHLIVGLELHFTAARGDLDVVLERCLTILEQAHDQHYLAGTSHLFGVTAIILARVDRAAIGAELIGSMIANGHLPRDNARRTIEEALGDRVAAAIDQGRALSTNEAAALATGALRAAISERRPPTDDGGRHDDGSRDDH